MFIHNSIEQTLRNQDEDLFEQIARERAIRLIRRGERLYDTSLAMICAGVEHNRTDVMVLFNKFTGLVTEFRNDGVEIPIIPDPSDISDEDLFDESELEAARKAASCLFRDIEEGKRKLRKQYGHHCI